MPKQEILCILVSRGLYNRGCLRLLQKLRVHTRIGSIADVIGMLMRKLFLQMGDQELAPPRDHA